MRSRWTVMTIVLAGLVLAPSIAGAAQDVQAEIRALRQRMSVMEDRLRATSDELAATQKRAAEQQKVIERSGLATGSGASSGMESFVQSLKIGGWVNGSYWYNANQPDNNYLQNGNVGRFATSNPLNPDADTFSLDQLWFRLERPVDEAHRAGFHTDILFGKTAGLLSPSSNGRSSGFAGDATDLYVHQAYIEYLAPIGNGIDIKAGKFATLIGYEVLGAPENFNISRGLVWNLLQPIDHLGVLASMPIGDGMDVALGVVNGFSDFDPDHNKGKSLLWHLGYTQEKYALSLNGIWGNDDPKGASSTGPVGDDATKTGVVDLVATYNPTQALALWLNGDYMFVDPSKPAWPIGGRSKRAWGLAVGGRYAFTERTGFAWRGEWVSDHGALFTGGVADSTLYSLTGTLDHHLTEHLLVRAEVRWDSGSLEGLADNFFIDTGARGATVFPRKTQTVIGADVTYKFN